MYDALPMINIEGVAARYPTLDVPNRYQRRLLAVYILNLCPGDVIEVVTSPVESVNTDWHAREFFALVPVSAFKGRRGCLSITKTRESSAAVEAILHNRMLRSTIEPHPSVFRGRRSAPLRDPRLCARDDRWNQLQLSVGNNPQVQAEDALSQIPYVRWGEFPDHWNVWTPNIVKSEFVDQEDVDDDNRDHPEVVEHQENPPVEE